MIQRWCVYAEWDGVDHEPCEDGRYVEYDDHVAAVRELVEALETWEQFFETMPKGQFGNISCDIGLMNDGFLKMRAALEKYKEKKLDG